MPEQSDARKNPSSAAKISEPFSRRLGSYRPDQMVHAVVIVETGDGVPVGNGRRSRQERRRAMDRIHRRGNAALPEIDSVLQHFQGRRLSDSVDALGCVAVETTVAGIKALASSDRVRAILEDQPISLIQ